jgi:predicted dehydrogenase
MARRYGLKLQVGHIERFNPAFLALKDKAIKPLFVEAHRLCQFNPRGTDVSVILDLMIHDIDIVLTLIPSPVASIHACGVQVVSESEDIANVRLSFADGSVANLTASRISAKDMRKMRLFQRSNYVAIDFLTRKTEILSLAESDSGQDLPSNAIPVGQIGSGDNRKDVLLDVPAISEVNSLELELTHFAEAILGQGEVPVPGEDGLRALEVAEVILEQIKRPE